MASGSYEKDPYRVAKLILALRQWGVTEPALLNAVEALPREPFLAPDLAEFAYEDVALPIPCGQIASPPPLAVAMIDALKLGISRTMNVLEIGTGSGYMTALLSRLSRRVNTLDRFRTLSTQAQKRFDELGLANITSHCSDGFDGWPQAAPFDRIISTCALEDLPEAWSQQVKPGGIILVPIGTNEDQRVLRFTKTPSGSMASETLMPSNFLHLIAGVAKQL